MATSKIIKAEIYNLDIPFHAPFRIALGVKSASPPAWEPILSTNI